MFGSGQGSPCVTREFSQGWAILVMTEDFMSRPTDQACARDRALGVRMQDRSRKAHKREHQWQCCSHDRADRTHSARDRAHSARDHVHSAREIVCTTDLSSSQQCTVLCTIHGHCSLTLFKKKKKKRPPGFGHHVLDIIKMLILSI